MISNDLKEKYPNLFALRGLRAQPELGFVEAKGYIEQLKDTRKSLLGGAEDWYKSETIELIDELYNLGAKKVEVRTLEQGPFDRLYVQLPDDPDLVVLLMIKLATLKANDCRLIVGENVEGKVVRIRWF